MKELDYLMGKMPHQSEEATKTIDFIITEDCNLRCHYCYLVGKNSNRKMSFDTAKKTVDFVLNDKTISNSAGVIWSMGGGEALLEIELIDQLTDYIILKMKELNHHWINNYTISIGSNGLLYDHPKVQAYLKKNHRNVSIAITIDGNKEKHDGARVFADGMGSYDKVLKNVMLWLKQYPCIERVTKSTFSHDDLPYLKDSIINLWNIGIQYVLANIVYEDVWQEGDDLIFEQQLRELADYILAHDVWKEHTVRFFDPYIGFPMTENELHRSFCGSGKNMLSVDCDGNIYPCNRFTGFSLSNKKGFIIGNIYQGIDENKLRAFLSHSTKIVSNKECLNCGVNSLCSYCSGHNYDISDSDTIFQKATYICKMHQANVRACEYFWDKFKRVTGLESIRDKIKAEILEKYNYSNKPRTLLFILNDAVTPHCRYITKKEKSREMSLETFKRGVDYAEKNGYIPVFIGDDITKYMVEIQDIAITSSSVGNINENHLIVFDEKTEGITPKGEICVILISKNSIDKLTDLVIKVKGHFKRLNIIIKDLLDWGDEETSKYGNQLEKLIELLLNDIKEKNYYDINVLTDRIKLNEMNNCDAGEESISLAPDGKLYLCPAFYFDNPSYAVGSLENGFEIKNRQLLSLEYAPVCSICDAYQCNRCKYLNLKATGEINIPSKIQCVISHIERDATRKLQLRLQEENMAAFMEILPDVDYLDPIDKILMNKGNKNI